MIEKLKELSSELGFNDLLKRLEDISASLYDSKAPLILPLVGEFSAGKTTLINSLSDSKALQCAIKPTTSTIYTIHFGADESGAVVHYQNGEVSEIKSISDLDNKELADAVFVDVYDTSDKVPSSIMLVDTPGLSSNDIKHRQSLVDFLPQADAVLLAVDVNQPITRSLTDFAQTIELSGRPLYLILTQCDTKLDSEIEEQKKYILNNTGLHLAGVACVSAKNDDVEELLTLFESIQADKTEILKRVNESRCRDIAKMMIQRIDTMLKSSESEEYLENEIQDQQHKLNQLEREISNISESIKSEIESAGDAVSRKFENLIFDRLDPIVANSSANHDAEVIVTINNTSSVLLSEFKSKVLTIYRNASSKCVGLTELGVSNYDLDSLVESYNLNLNEAGHEYDMAIGGAIKAAAVGAAVVATVATAGAAAPATAAATTGTTALTVKGMTTVVSVADAATDVASIIANTKAVKRINEAVELGKRCNDQFAVNMAVANGYDERWGRQLGQKKGLVNGVVSFATERMLGRPQRRRMIAEYISDTLLPLFESEIERIAREMTTDASDVVRAAYEEEITTMTDMLNQLQDDRDGKRDEYDAKVKLLKKAKGELALL